MFWSYNTTSDYFLRTVPTIVSAHTFCPSRKTWFKSALGLTLTQSTTLLMKAKFSYSDEIEFKTRNTRVSLSSNCLRLSAEKLAVICRRLYWNRTLNMKKAGLASRNIVHLQKIILRCVGFCFYIFFIYMWSRLLIQRIPAGSSFRLRAKKL